MENPTVRAQVFLNARYGDNHINTRLEYFKNLAEFVFSRDDQETYFLHQIAGDKVFHKEILDCLDYYYNMDDSAE